MVFDGTPTKSMIEGHLFSYLKLKQKQVNSNSIYFGRLAVHHFVILWNITKWPFIKRQPLRFSGICDSLWLHWSMV